MKWWRLLVFFCALGQAALFFDSISRGAPLAGQGIGAYGDSMTMQYSFWTPLATQYGHPLFYNGTQFNWVDELVKSGYNFGPTNTLLGETYNTYDGAIVGDQSIDVVNTQVPAMQSLVSAGALHVLVDIIGPNDFDGNEFTVLYNNAASKTYKPANDPAAVAFANNVYNNILTAVNETLAENPGQKMILATIPDVGITPEFKTNYPNATQRAAVTQVIQMVNSQIISLGASHHFPVVDLFSAANLTQTLTSFAGVNMVDTGGTSGKDMFLSDGFHPGTVVQGILANAILQADHVAYGDSVSFISDQQIAKWAGLTPNKSTTYFNVAPYIYYTAPEPSSLLLAFMGALGLLLAANARRLRRMAEGR